jgi:hypothetical protein
VESALAAELRNEPPAAKADLIFRLNVTAEAVTHKPSRSATLLGKLKKRFAIQESH